MKIQMGANQKTKLYNVYRLCKQHINYLNSGNVIIKEGSFFIPNWNEFEEKLDSLKKIPILKEYITDYIVTVPAVVRENVSTEISYQTSKLLNSKREKIIDIMKTIVELYESMDIPEGNIGLDIKLPPCEDLKDYISYLKSIDFIFSKCPFLQCENEILKFGSVDVGSNWLRLTIAATSTCLILNNTASIVDKALGLRSHYISIQQQEEMLKTMQLKNEFSKEQIVFFKSLRDAAMNNYINQLESEFRKLENPEDRDKAERSLEELVMLIDKGCEIYATLDSPEDVQLLFPEIQSNLELSDDVIKYLETKEKE